MQRPQPAMSVVTPLFGSMHVRGIRVIRQNPAGRRSEAGAQNHVRLFEWNEDT